MLPCLQTPLLERQLCDCGLASSLTTSRKGSLLTGRRSSFGPLGSCTRKLPILLAAGKKSLAEVLCSGHQLGTTWKACYPDFTKVSLTCTRVGQLDYHCDLEVGRLLPGALLY
ncbi:hypothetical protein Nepgr_002796 [Nepenthes gracilis]|uniref:Uncharacterized protein n=1 Tax=Nepenthes gracilis TaxID=150966 RepID=A0AAD3P7R2_NEPGR|nr:hypothetical protein Nepgr_002796 [Nepenthes gracilis]